MGNLTSKEPFSNCNLQKDQMISKWVNCISENITCNSDYLFRNTPIEFPKELIVFQETSRVIDISQLYFGMRL